MRRPHVPAGLASSAFRMGSFSAWLLPAWVSWSRAWRRKGPLDPAGPVTALLFGNCLAEHELAPALPGTAQGWPGPVRPCPGLSGARRGASEGMLRDCRGGWRNSGAGLDRLWPGSGPGLDRGRKKAGLVPQAQCMLALFSQNEHGLAGRKRAGCPTRKPASFLRRPRCQRAGSALPEAGARGGLLGHAALPASAAVSGVSKPLAGFRHGVPEGAELPAGTGPCLTLRGRACLHASPSSFRRRPVPERQWRRRGDSRPGRSPDTPARRQQDQTPTRRHPDQPS